MDLTEAVVSDAVPAAGTAGAELLSVGPAADPIAAAGGLAPSGA